MERSGLRALGTRLKSQEQETHKLPAQPWASRGRSFPHTPLQTGASRGLSDVEESNCGLARGERGLGA